MSDTLKIWPKWPEFTLDSGEIDDYTLQPKQSIIAQYGKEKLMTAWIETCKHLETVTEEIKSKGTSLIPDIHFDDIDTVPIEAIKARGCCVIRDVVSQPTASQWFRTLEKFVADNKGSVATKAWPNNNPILRLYYTPTQMKARSHPNQLKIQSKLNSLWHDSETDMHCEPLTYAGAFKIRVPGIPFFGLGPHMDAGSLCRWADPVYRGMYDKVFSGKLAELDLYDMAARKKANQAIFDKGAQSSVLRTFQGWMAITPLNPDEGGMLLYPNLETVIAYMLLRPFFRPPPDDKDLLDATTWTLDHESGWFPGTFRDKSQMASLSSHPHLKLTECMVHLPKMQPGDTIWWHSDMMHAVEVDHNGPDDTAVICWSGASIRPSLSTCI